MLRRLVLVLVAAVLVVSACGSGSSDNGSNKSGTTTTEKSNEPTCPLDALAKHQGKVQVVLWFGGLGAETLATMQDSAKRFNASQDKVQIIPRNQGKSYEEVSQKYQSAASASPGDLPGIVYLENTTLRSMIDGGTILPAEACMKAAGYDPDQIDPAIRAYYTVDKLMWPGYVNVNTQVLYYDKAKFARAGLDPNKPPQTLDQLEAVAKKLKTSGVAKPLALKLSHTFFEMWVSGGGGTVVNNSDGRDGSPTEATFAGEQGRKTMDWLVKMNKEGLLFPVSSTAGQVDQFLAVLTGKSAMTIETSGAATTIAAFLKGDLSARDATVAGVNVDPAKLKSAKTIIPGAAAFPGLNGPGNIFPGGGAFFIVNRKDPAVQAGAWKYLEFMLKPENGAKWLLQGSYLPLVKATAELPEVKSFFANDVAGVLLKPSYEQFKQVDPFAPGPLIGPYSDVGKDIQKAMEGVLLGGSDPASTLSKAQSDATAALKRYSG